MENELIEIHSNIEDIRIALRKLGPEKWKIRKKYAQEKYNQAKKLYELFNSKLD